jgi:O-antigen/teichoic acid export membrane protein
MDKKWLERILRFSIPTILFSVSAFIFAGSDRLQIEHFLGSEAVGHYSAIAQISALVSVISTSFNAAWMPWLFENLKKEDASLRFFIVKLSYALMLAFVLLGFTFALALPFIAQIILTPEYLPYVYVSYALIAGFVFQGLYFIVGPFLWYTEKTKYLGYGGIGIAILNILLNLIFIPHFGILGAAFSNCISWACLFLFTFFIANKVYEMPWFSFFQKNKL